MDAFSEMKIHSAKLSSTRKMLGPSGLFSIAKSQFEPGASFSTEADPPIQVSAHRAALLQLKPCPLKGSKSDLGTP
jgi:hypothetical protein